MTDQGVRSYRLNLQDTQVLEQIVRTYSEPLIRYAYSMLGSFAAAEDAMEDAIAALLVKGGAFRSEEHLRGWLYRTTRNKSIDYLRRHKREVPLEDVENVLHTWDAEQNVFLRQRNQSIYRCMQTLPEQYREVLVLAYFEGFDVERICAIQRKSAKQVYNLLSRARTSLKEKLREEGISCEDLR